MLRRMWQAKPLSYERELECIASGQRSFLGILGEAKSEFCRDNL